MEIAPAAVWMIQGGREVYHFAPHCVDLKSNLISRCGFRLDISLAHKKLPI
jgi:hypothetical protein